MKKEFCIHNNYCGGCKYNGIPYEEQIENKKNLILDSLEKNQVNVDTIYDFKGAEADNRFSYRNKMEYTFGDFIKDGKIALGMHKPKNFMSITTVDNCLLVDEDFNKILAFTLDFANENSYKAYNKKNHQGLLRNLVIRKGERTKELLVNIITTSQTNFNQEAFVKGILNLKLNNKVTSILQTYNDNIADSVICEKLVCLYGKDYYMEEIAGLKFKVSPFSFFQTNVPAAEKLYLDAISLVENFENKNVFDLYCGTGTISQIVATKAKSVLGIELVDEAVDSAKLNASLNGLKNCNFISGDVFKVLETRNEKPDLIIVDPPRMGMTNKAVSKVAKYGVKEILYISCNPKTLAINLDQFQQLGYKVKSLRGYDNFPGTKHVECVALLTR